MSEFGTGHGFDPGDRAFHVAGKSPPGRVPSVPPDTELFRLALVFFFALGLGVAIGYAVGTRDGEISHAKAEAERRLQSNEAGTGEESAGAALESSEESPALQPSKPANE